MVLVQGCTLPSAYMSAYLDKYSCFDAKTYGIDIIGNIDFSGHADSYVKFDCPQFLSGINITIEGTDRPIEKPEPKEHVIEDVCCLPF